MRNTNSERDLSWPLSFIANAMISKLLLITICIALVVQFCPVDSHAQMSWDQAGSFQERAEAT